MTMALPGEPVSLRFLARATSVLLLLSGVIALHALTAGHSGGSVTSWSSAAEANFAKPAPSAAGANFHGAGLGADLVVMASTAPTAGALAHDACVDCEEQQAPAHTGSHLLELCLAVLAAAALVLLLLIGCARRAGHLLTHTRMTVSSAIQHQVGEQRPPSLYKLCVMRT